MTEINRLSNDVAAWTTQRILLGGPVLRRTMWQAREREAMMVYGSMMRMCVVHSYGVRKVSTGLVPTETKRLAREHTAAVQTR